MNKENALANYKIVIGVEYLNDLFNFTINFLDENFDGHIFNLNKYNKIKNSNYLDGVLNKIQIRVLNIYWGPIDLYKYRIKYNCYANQILIE